MTSFTTRLDKPLAQLLRDFGYRVDGTSLVSVGVRGFTSDRIVRRVRGLFDAAEQLIPIIHEDAYYERFRRICN